MKDFRQQNKRPKKNTLIVGRDSVEDALQDGVYLDKILLQTNVQSEQIELIKKLALEHGVPITRVPVEKINFLNVSNHHGCVAYKARVQYHDLQSVISHVVDSGQVPLFVLLDGITDIRNIGAIARGAYALGAQTLIVPEKGVGALNDDAVLTSAGALDHLLICRVSNILSAIELLHLNGIKVVGTAMRASHTISGCDLKIPVAFVLGSEERGVQRVVLDVCDEVAQIPMSSDFESLNVAVAAGIVFYETCRQRAASS